MISIRGLSKTFNKGKPNELRVLRDLSLELPEKGMVAIFGRSGCGKTTFLNALGGLDRFDKGDILVDGESIRRDSDRIRNEKIGFIFQNYNLQKGISVFDNVAYALRLAGLNDGEQIERRVLAALRNVGMSRFRGRMPETLSGGQQQRVAIARAIVKNPSIILADEPTGNLDDANTLLVMDLLRQIAEDRLVVLVTHEARLVDYYCDTVVELADGRIAGLRENRQARGVTVREQGAVYLGELPGSLDRGRFADIACYGDPPEKPVKLTLVRANGRTYLRVDGPGVEIVDENSEVQLKAGVYREEEQARQQEERIDMRELGPVAAAGPAGRLFGLKQSVKSGFEENFRKKKKKKNKLFRASMVLFSAVFVLLAAFFGVALRDIRELESGYDRQLFYVYLGNKNTAARLEEALQEPDSGLDALYCSERYSFGTETVSFTPGYFETFGDGFFRAGIGTEAVYLPQSLLQADQLLAGTAADLGEKDIVISSTAADRLLEEASYGYIRVYRDLLGLKDTEGRTIRGVAESAEPAIYLSDTALAEFCLKGSGAALIRSGEVPDYGDRPAAGEAVLVVQYETADAEKPEAGESILIYGRPLTVTRVVEIAEDDPEDAAFYREIFLYDSSWKECVSYQDQFFLVSDEDYVLLSRSFGESHPLADPKYSFDAQGSLRPEALYGYVGYYATLHAADPKAAAAYLEENFGGAPALGRESGLITPESLQAELMEDRLDSIKRNLIGMGIMLAILSLCMYFMMRASLMGHIREIGIYRAIGVTKRNLRFRFLTESAVLMSLTVLLGYVLSSAALFYWLGSSGLMRQLFFYPVWLALLVLAVLVLLCLFCGTLPVTLLLRRTPSEILAKYDI